MFRHCNMSIGKYCESWEIVQDTKNVGFIET